MDDYLLTKYFYFIFTFFSFFRKKKKDLFFQYHFILCRSSIMVDGGK
jgi:hypothetical protein